LAAPTIKEVVDGYEANYMSWLDNCEIAWTSSKTRTNIVNDSQQHSTETGRLLKKGVYVYQDITLNGKRRTVVSDGILMKKMHWNKSRGFIDLPSVVRDSWVDHDFEVKMGILRGKREESKPAGHSVTWEFLLHPQRSGLWEWSLSEAVVSGRDCWLVKGIYRTHSREFYFDKESKLCMRRCFNRAEMGGSDLIVTEVQEIDGALLPKKMHRIFTTIVKGGKNYELSEEIVYTKIARLNDASLDIFTFDFPSGTKVTNRELGETYIQ
jgi:hypothetical protein